jgi:hypothetical protein
VDGFRSSRAHRFREWLITERWTIAIVLAALFVRLHWNLFVHPLGEYVYSDMNGYVTRAERLVRDPFTPYEYNAFFPFGTHAMVAAFKAVFGKDNYVPIGIGYAVMGTSCVLAAMRIATRVSPYPWVAPAVGLLLVFYYPHLSIGGYVLSEMPFSACLLLGVWFSIRLVDLGNWWDAMMMGIFAGLGAMFRPQILMAVALIGLFWLVRRKALPRVRFVHLVVAGIPLAILLGLSAAHFRWNTGRTGLVSENGPFNMTFGRCHNSKIEALPDGKKYRGKVHFRPPEFLQLNNLKDRKLKEGKEPPIQLHPTLEDVLSYKGYIGDTAKHKAYIRQCLEMTSIWTQIEYSYTNAILIWRYNVPWPDSGRAQWRDLSRSWTRVHEMLFALPSFLILFTLFRKDTVRHGWLALHMLSAIVVAALYFGGTRHRASYDPLFLFFALEVYSFLGVWIVQFVRRRRQRRAQGGAAESGGSSAHASSSS